MSADSSSTYFSTFRHQGMLGTMIDVSVRAASDAIAESVDAIIVADVERLQRTFNRFDPDSDLRRWQRGIAAPSQDVLTVLDRATYWHQTTGGAFDPRVGRLYERWSFAEQEGRVPTGEEIEAMLTSGDRALDLEDPAAVAALDLNAIAKGWIVDRAVEHGLTSADVAALMVNAGGDLLHRGRGSVRIGIENPLRPRDNEPPVSRIEVTNAAVATSGGARRFWSIDGTRFPRVLDPRTGQPTDELASASVVAGDAESADVLATAVVVLGIDEGLALAQRLDVALCCVTPEGDVVTNESWRELSIN